MTIIQIKKYDAPVLIVGGSNVDYVGRLEQGIKFGTSSPSKIRKSYGGVARNVAENLGRLGLSTTLVSVIGDDSHGQELLEYLSTVGVNVENFIKSSKFPTGTYLAALNSEAKLEYAIHDMRVVTEITSQFLRINYSLVKNSSLVFIDGNLQENSIKTIFSLARRAKTPVFVDPASEILASKFLPHLSDICILTANSFEISALIGENFKFSEKSECVKAAKHLVSLGVEIVIITLGENGVCYATAETSGFVPAINTSVEDPTGAGNAFSALVIFAIMNDILIDEAVRLGATAAAITLRYPGSVDKSISIDKIYNELIV